MKPILKGFCCLAPLRSGCIIIGYFMIITATMYLFGYFSRQQPEDDRKREYMFHQGVFLSLIGCTFNYVIGVLILIGAYLGIALLILLAAVVLLLYTGFALGAALYSSLWEHHYVYCASFIIYAVLEFYFCVIAYSYFAEIVEEQRFWSSIDEEYRNELQEQRTQAKDRGLPDPLKAALRKYRTKPSDDEDPKTSAEKKSDGDKKSDAGPSK